jgi:hypothetical protein
MNDETDVKILPVQILPTSVYKIGTDEGVRLRYGAELEAEDLLVIAIKAAQKDPKLIPEAIERFLVEETQCSSAK